MALIVGNLLTDPAVQSFVNLADADAYLGLEQNDAWNALDATHQEAALVRASRWLAATYRFMPLDDAGLRQVGRIAARLAAETFNRPLFAGTDTGRSIRSMSAGSVSITYANAMRADAAGMTWPWLKPMLGGLVVSGSTTFLARA